MQGFADGLCQEQAVKGIGVMEWQIRYQKCMPGPDGQLLEAVSLYLIEELLRIGVHFAQADFDRNLPNGG